MLSYEVSSDLWLHKRCKSHQNFGGFEILIQGSGFGPEVYYSGLQNENKSNADPVNMIIIFISIKTGIDTSSSLVPLSFDRSCPRYFVAPS